MILDNYGMGCRESTATAFTYRFCGEEWVEDLIDQGRRNTGAGIRHFKTPTLFLLAFIHRRNRILYGFEPARFISLLFEYQVKKMLLRLIPFLLMLMFFRHAFSFREVLKRVSCPGKMNVQSC
jgi:hypothetical protein